MLFSKIKNFFYFINKKKLNSLFVILSLISIFTFFLGFNNGENSAGAGGYSGDFQNTWNNLNTFLNHNINTALNFIKEGNRNFYVSSRTPLLYILNAKLNPFTYAVDVFINSIFFFSLFGFIIFYFTLSDCYKNLNKSIIILISSCLLLSPYYRTSAFWGAEENYGIISTIISFLFFNKFIKIKNKLKQKILFLSLSIFFSSLCVYLDQKLIIIPLLIFLKIILMKGIDQRIKLLSSTFYFLLSLPFFYFMYEWKSVIPSGDSVARGVGVKIMAYHPAYVITIISFYLIPILFLEKFYLKKIIINKKVNLILITLFILYLSLLVYYNNFDLNGPGKGIIFKFVSTIFDNIILKKLLIIFFSTISFFIILLYCNKNLLRLIFIFYFILSSLFIYPVYQEYFDPIIFIVCLYFLETKSILII